MGNNPRPINSVDFLKKLPAFYAQDYKDGQLFKLFLKQFEVMFAELQSAIVGDALTLTYRNPGNAESDSGSGFRKETAALRGNEITVDPFDSGHLGYPEGSQVFIRGNPNTTILTEPIEADSKDNKFIRVKDSTVLGQLEDGVQFVVRTNSGLAGLTDLSDMPPCSYEHLDEKSLADLQYLLQYLASWVGLPLRSDKPPSWNRRFLREAVALDNEPRVSDQNSMNQKPGPVRLRSTLPGIKALLDLWHQGEVEKDKTIVTDLLSPANYTEEQEKFFRKYYPDDDDLRTVCCLGESRIGVDTQLGEGERGRFHVYLTADPNDANMRQPKNLDAMAAAAELILNMEKPVGTEYTLHIDAYTMQLAPDLPSGGGARNESAAGAAVEPAGAAKAAAAGEAAEELAKDSNTFARIGVTTLLWGGS